MADEKIPGRIPVEGVQPVTGDPRDNLIRYDNQIRVLVEMRVPKDSSDETIFNLAAPFEAFGLRLDRRIPPSKVSPKETLAKSMEETNEESAVISGMIPQNRIEDLKRQPKVIDVYADFVVESFGGPSP